MLITQEQAMVRDMARQFAAERLAPFAAEWDRTASFPLARLCANPVGFCIRVGMLKRGSMPRRASGWRAERGFLPCPGIGLKPEKVRPPRVVGAQRRGRH